MVTCRLGAHDTCPSQALAVIQKFQGRSILGLNQNHLKKEILATGYGELPKLKYDLSGKLHLSLDPITNSYPVLIFPDNGMPTISMELASTSAQLVAPSVDLDNFLATISGRSYQLLESGAVVESGDESRVFLINQDQSSSQVLSQVFRWIKEISGRGIKYQSLYFVGQLIIVKQNQPPEIIFSLSKNWSDQITTLQEIMKVATIKDTKVIDFTYNHPILR